LTYSFSGGLVLSLIFLTIVVALPVKLAAYFAGASRTGLIWCGASVAVGLVAGCLAAALLGGFFGGPFMGFIGFVLGIRLMLGTSFVAAIGLSVIAFGLSLVGLLLLVHFGLILSSNTVPIST
jgi:hypothetical protein